METILYIFVSIIFIAVLIFLALTLAMAAVDSFLTTMEHVEQYKEDHKHVKNR